MRLQSRRLERIARRDGALAQAGREPALALLGAAVGERVRDHVAARLALQRVVADRRRGAHRRLDVALLDEGRPAAILLALVLVERPDAGKAVGLQLDPHLQLICLRTVEAALLLLLLHLRQYAEQVLHVMAYLVGNHIGLAELAGLAAGVAAAETG